MRSIKFLVLLGVMSILTTTSASAKSRCMPAALNHVLQDFEQRRNTTGIKVTIADREADYEERTIVLGKNVAFMEVSVSDILKNSYLVKIRLSDVNGERSRLIIQASVSVDINSCVPHSYELNYLAYTSREGDLF